MSGSTSGRTVVIVQARMSSTRLPGKVLADLGGRPVVDRVVERASRAASVDAVVVATSDRPDDDVLVEHLEADGIQVFRGDVDDVLSRFIVAARGADADTVVRITSDCPFVEPDVIDAVVESLRAEPATDYCTNTLVRTYPIGLDVEAMTRDALERAAREATEQHEREHVTPFIYQHPGEFRLRNVEAPGWAAHPEWRLTVDVAADLELARALYARLPEGFDLAQLMAVLREEPSLLELNSDVAHRHTEKPDSW